MAAFFLTLVFLFTCGFLVAMLSFLLLHYRMLPGRLRRLMRPGFWSCSASRPF
jgi:hypothetical protein